MTNKQVLTDESARESGNILLIVAARMARRELFTPLHYVSELPKKVVSMRVLREALERSEETLQHEVCKIVDGHNRMAKKLKEAEEKLQAAEKRLSEITAPNMLLPAIDDLDENQLRHVIKTCTENYSLLHSKWEAAEKRVAELESERDKQGRHACELFDEVAAQRQRIAELEASHGNLREAMAGIHNTITGGGTYTPLAAILNASKRAYEESAIAAGRINGEG